MNSIYELDSKWRKLLTSNNFLGGLTVNEFVEQLSRDHSIKGRSGSNAPKTAFESLDPKPYIRTFEFILKELNSLSGESSERKHQLAEQVSHQEIEHAQSVIALSANLKHMMGRYDQLDHQLTSVNQVVSPLGEKLEIAIRKKKGYIKSVELITQYHEFYANGGSSYLETLRLSSNWLKKTQAAILVKNLLVLAFKVETSSIKRTVEVAKLIEEYSEVMEKNLLESFNNAYRDNNFTQLNEIALILNQFNGGVNVIHSFINQHAYFIDSDQVHRDETTDIFLDEDFKQRLIDPSLHGVVFEKSMVQLLNDVERVVKNESKVVKRVFEERAPQVIQLFMQRIFAQKIEAKIDHLLAASQSLSNLAYVRMLHALYSLLGQFIKDLSEFFQLLEIDVDNVLTASLEQSYSELFSKYLYDRTKYFDVEKKSLETILFEKTANFNMKYERSTRSRALANRLTSSLENGLEINGLATTSSSKLSQLNSFFKSHIDKDRLGINRVNSLNRSNTLSNRDPNQSVISNQETADLSSTDDDGFNLQNADAMLKCVVESIARVMELASSKAGNYSFELLEVMLIGIVSSYVDTALEAAYSESSKSDVAKPQVIQLGFLRYISLSTDILSLTSASVKAIFLPLLNNSPAIKSKIVVITNNQITRCELLINITLEEVCRVILTKFSNCLAKQKKKDFSPKSQELLDHDTLPAVEIVGMLNSLYSQVTLYLKGENLVSFLEKIGEGLYSLLLDHYMKFQVSSAGGIIVTKDIIGYQTAIKSWGIAALNEAFSTLRELANLFTVQSDLLDSLTKEGQLAEVSRDIISAYVSNREDFSQDSFIAGVRMNLKQHI